MPFDDIDGQHGDIVALLNDTHDALERSGFDADLFARKCMELSDKLTEHFRHEERLMESTEYERLREHCAHHRRIHDKIAGIASSRPGDARAVSELLDTLYDAVIVEVLRTDLDFKSFLESKGLIDLERH